MQPIKPIRTEADYERALQEINLYLDADEEVKSVTGLSC
jgi:antitoxin component HigA of HigAB toxin-antitoxin module